MFNTKKLFDNYVGLIIKCLKSFFNYLEKDRNISVGIFHKSFFVPVEDIPIIALTSEQLNYIIYNDDFKKLVKQHDLVKIKDIFVFGCTVALRVSDLLSLSKKNLVNKNENYYLNVKSQKQIQILRQNYLTMQLIFYYAIKDRVHYSCHLSHQHGSIHN